MTNFGYIDESGTKDDQHVMTVALIVVEGSAAAAVFHQHVLRSVHPKYREKKRRQGSEKPLLHYAKMKKEQLRAIGRVLAQHPITCFVSYYYHDGAEKTHEERHRIYQALVKNCLSQALEHYDDLTISIAQQGDWQTYKDAMVNGLEAVVANSSQRFGFKKVKFQFQSASKPGIQLADFFAGASRGFLLKYMDGSLGAPYELISRQVRDLQMEGGEIPTKAKG